MMSYKHYTPEFVVVKPLKLQSARYPLNCWFLLSQPVLTFFSANHSQFSGPHTQQNPFYNYNNRYCLISKRIFIITKFRWNKNISKGIEFLQQTLIF